MITDKLSMLKSKIVQLLKIMFEILSAQYYSNLIEYKYYMIYFYILF